MSLNWIDKNDDKRIDSMSSTCHMAKKVESFSEGNGKESINIVMTNSNLADSLHKAFSKLEDNFPTLELRLGWINSEGLDKEDLDVLFSKSLIIGEDKYIKGYMEVPNVKTLHVSSKAVDNDKYLAYQRHFSNHSNPNSISLGELRHDRSDAETAIRSAKVINFNIDAMRSEDSQSPHSHTAGMDIYESCHLMRLAGLSKALDLMCINTVSDHISDKTADAIACQINKEIETMKQKENDIFLVSSELFEEPIKFVVGHKTGRWWYQHPSTKEYLPCSDKDYTAISMGNLPDAIVAIQH